MRPAIAEDSRPDLLRWMDPLAADVISIAYAAIMQDEAACGSLVRCHMLLWRGLLGGQIDVLAFRRELSRLAGIFGLAESAVETVNQYVLAELFHVVAMRHTRSPREAASVNHHLALIASRLAQISPVAVPSTATPAAVPRAQRLPQQGLALAMRRA